MSEREAFERILASLHEAAFDPARWSSASALIDEALGVHGNSMVFGTGDSREDDRHVRPRRSAHRDRDRAGWLPDIGEA